MARATVLAGRTLGNIAAEAGVMPPVDARRTKGWIGDLMEWCLGATASNLPEPDFLHIQVELKTVPVNRRGRPGESTYVCHVPLAGELGTWERSNVRRKLARVLWVPVESARDIPLLRRRVGSPVLWTPDTRQESLLRRDWEEFAEWISTGKLDQVHSRFGTCLQIRPKAANARALTGTFDETGTPARTLPRGFYLRSSFTAGILAALPIY